MTRPLRTAALAACSGLPALPAEIAFRPLDLAILLGYLALTVAIGLRVGRGRRTASRRNTMLSRRC